MLLAKQSLMDDIDMADRPQAKSEQGERLNASRRRRWGATGK